MRFLAQPVSPWKVNQFFGEDKACLQIKDGKTVISKVGATCPTGYKSLYALTQGHNGLDLQARRWQEVYASHSGLVTEVETETARGLGVGIVSDEYRHFKETGNKSRYKTRYWHLIAIDVHKGDRVKVGDLIGYADSTGYSTSDHLHFELKPVQVFATSPDGKTIAYKNATSLHLGAVDPLQYMEDVFAVKKGGMLKQIAELMAKISVLLADRLRNK